MIPMRSSRLSQLRPYWRLSDLKKSPDQFTFAAHDHAGKSLKPFSVRNFRFRRQPVGQQTKLINLDMAALDAIQQVSPKVSRQALSLNPRHG